MLMFERMLMAGRSCMAFTMMDHSVLTDDLVQHFGQAVPDMLGQVRRNEAVIALVHARTPPCHGAAGSLIV